MCFCSRAREGGFSRNTRKRTDSAKKAWTYTKALPHTSLGTGPDRTAPRKMTPLLRKKNWRVNARLRGRAGRSGKYAGSARPCGELSCDGNKAQSVIDENANSDLLRVASGACDPSHDSTDRRPLLHRQEAAAGDSTPACRTAGARHVPHAQQASAQHELDATIMCGRECAT